MSSSTFALATEEEENYHSEMAFLSYDDDTYQEDERHLLRTFMIANLLRPHDLIDFTGEQLESVRHLHPFV